MCGQVRTRLLWGLTIVCLFVRSRGLRSESDTLHDAGVYQRRGRRDLLDGQERHLGKRRVLLRTGRRLDTVAKSCPRMRALWMAFSRRKKKDGEPGVGLRVAAWMHRPPPLPPPPPAGVLDTHTKTYGRYEMHRTTSETGLAVGAYVGRESLPNRNGREVDSIHN